MLFLHFKYKLFFLTFKNPEKKVFVSTKLLSSTTDFNNDNNKKCFMSNESAYQNDFWRIVEHWRLE